MQPRSRNLIGLAAATALALAACSSGSDGAADPSADVAARTITTTAVGEATGVPDTVTADVAVATVAPSASEALDENNAKTRALVDALVAADIAEADIATTDVSLGPTFDDDGNPSGYRAGNSLRVTLRDLGTAGAQLDLLTDAVGDAGRIGGLQLGFDDDDALRSAARADAVQRATAQAREMADAGGAELGEIQTIAEVPDGGFAAEEVQLRAVSADGGVPIEAGSRDLTVQVEVVYALV